MLARLLKAFISDDRGATAIEYALLGTLIAIALLGTVATVGNNLFNLMGEGPGSAATVMAEQSAKLE